MAEEEKIARVLQAEGPLTGSRLQELTLIDIFALWRSCRLDPALALRRAGKMFLRLDRAVKGYARLSPSIRREFQTYTVIALAGQAEAGERRLEELRNEIERISRRKIELARRAVAEAVKNLPDGEGVRRGACFLIAGDVTYSMAHSVPRPEVSTGWTVKGSDLDIVAIGEDELGAEVFSRLDKSLHDRKYFYLAHPDWREELDYIVKPLSRFREQLEFKSFQDMVACKIIREAHFLYGSLPLLEKINRLLADRAIPARLDRLEETAIRNRERAERQLLSLPAGELTDEFHALFYTTEERMEDLF